MLLKANKYRKDKKADCRQNELGSRIFVGRAFGDYAKCLHFYPSFSYGRIIAGESQGVMRAPWRTHLPAVRAVWGFHAGVVERAKTALLGSEAQIITTGRAGGLHRPPWGLLPAEPIGSSNLLSTA